MPRNNTRSEVELNNATIAGNVSAADYYAHYKQDDVTFSYKHTNEATGHVILGLSYRLNTAKKKATGANHS